MLLRRMLRGGQRWRCPTNFRAARLMVVVGGCAARTAARDARFCVPHWRVAWRKVWREVAGWIVSRAYVLLVLLLQKRRMNKRWYCGKQFVRTLRDCRINGNVFIILRQEVKCVWKKLSCKTCSLKHYWYCLSSFHNKRDDKYAEEYKWRWFIVDIRRAYILRVMSTLHIGVQCLVLPL